MTDINKRIDALDDRKRELLARLVSKSAEQRNVSSTINESETRPDEHTLQDEYDVAILGGGLAGLTLAIQLRRAVPQARILVVEANRFPVPEAAHKVGESSVEIGAHYFDSVLGFRPHMDQRQLRKMGLRFFFPYGDNSDLAKRVEIGPFANHVLPIPTYQIDRGRFENMLAVQASKEGAGVVDDCRVIGIDIQQGDTPHEIQLRRGGQEHRVKARWVVDGMGRPGFLRRKLGLARPSEHDVNAAWLRITVPINLEDWSDDPEFRGRMLSSFRQYSTNHLVGRGYWVWLIRLASGSTSVGIVADPRYHPLNEFNSRDRFIDWLDKNEPLVGRLVRERRDGILDFLALKKYAHTTSQIYSQDRWALIGDAGLFTDPLYSPGSDFVAMGNTLVTDMVRHDLSGGDLTEKVEFYNWFYLDFLYDTAIRVFQDQYGILGNAQVWIAKVIWDLVWYWATLGLIFFHNKIDDQEFLRSIRQELIHIQVLQRKTQDFLRSWDEATKHQVHTRAHVDLTRVNFVYPLVHSEMEGNFDDAALRRKLMDNISLLEATAAEMHLQAFGVLPKEPMTDSGFTLAEHMARAAERAEIRTQLRRCWLEPEREYAMAMAGGA
ncbi:MAG: FAD-dependent monooxygenase [Xanthobacteraceae bacterium]